MNSVKSFSSDFSVSSQSLNIPQMDSLPSSLSNKEESLQLCINEVNFINKTLNEKSEQLKQWENILISKENTIVKLLDSVNKFVECEVSNKSKKIISDTQDKYSQLEEKFNSLFKDYRRLQSSFESIKVQNKSLKLKIDENNMKEKIMNKEKEKLIAKLGLITTKKSQTSMIKLKDTSTQTSSTSQDYETCSPHTEKRLDPTLSFTLVLRQVWIQLLHTSMQDLFTSSSQCDQYSQPFVETCLLVIPISIEYLKAAMLTNFELSNSTCIRKRHLDNLTCYTEMLYWSIVYMDIARIPLRHGMVTPLARLGENLAHILISKISPTSSLKNLFTTDNQILSLLVLLSIRCVNQKDLLSLLLHFLQDIIERNKAMWGILLSKCAYAPLLCRWLSASSCYSSLYPKIFNLVFESFYEKIYYPEVQSSISFISHTNDKHIVTGLDQLVLLMTRLPIHMRKTDTTNTYHPLVLILDNLHTSKAIERETIISIIDKIIQNKHIRLLSRELGIISIISNLISQSGESKCDQTFPKYATKLKTILSCVAN